MSRLRNPALALFAAATVLGASACVSPDRAAAPDAGTALGLLGGGTPTLLQCGPAAAQSASGLITPLLGGTVSAGGVTIALPAGAVLENTTLSVSVPASPYVEVDIRANGAEHFAFLQTAVVTLSYARCGGGLLDLLAKEAWHIDPVTKQPLARMLGVDDTLARTVTFVTNHLSGYAIANRTGEGGGE